MDFSVIPTSGPVTVDGGATSPLFDFLDPDIAAETEEFFLRFIALWRDNDPLGGEAPTFQIRAGGVITSVAADGRDVSIPDARNQAAGSVNCVRLESDTYLLRISEIVENSGPWKIRIRNNDHETLRFFGFVSKEDRNTLQPWAVLTSPPLRFGERLTAELEVRNWGTAPLLFAEGSGTSLGGRDSPVRLAEIPASVKPHGSDVITLVADEVTARRTLEHQFLWNDTIESHGKLVMQVDPRRPSAGNRPRPMPPPEDSFACTRGCGCLEYLAGPGGVCRRPICRHGVLEHELPR